MIVLPAKLDIKIDVTHYTMKKLFFILIILTVRLQAQSVYVPLNSDIYHTIDRYEIKRKKVSEGFNSSVRPYTRKSVVQLADSVLQSEMPLSRSDQFNLAYLLNDSWEWADSTLYDTLSVAQRSFPVFKHLYKRKNDLYYVKEDNFDLHVSPVIGFSYGRDNQYNQPIFVNTRGAEIRGMIGRKVGFYTYLTDNQAKFPFYINDRIAERRAVPAEGFYKIEFAPNSSPRYDFFTARGYITFDVIKNITSLQFGHDRFAVGNGYRSLILSDYAPAYLFLKLNTCVWRLQYINLFTRMVADNDKFLGKYPRKYMAFHHLGINITDNLNLGVFESVVFSRNDSLGNNPWELDYLNPVIFYRASEHWLGDPDNVLLGADFKWNVAGKFRFYGQLVLDELIFKEFFKQSGWWGNKQALQVGAIYTDVVGIKNLDLQVEHNVVRPFTYTHFGSNTAYSNYQHYDQPLAHPLGANFREYIAVLRYQPFPRLFLTVKQLVSKQGRDGVGENWGSDIFKDYTTRSAPNPANPDFGHSIGQGRTTDLRYTSFTCSYMVRHNLLVDLQYISRQQTSPLPVINYNNTIWQIGVRWNLPQRQHQF